MQPGVAATVCGHCSGRRLVTQELLAHPPSTMSRLTREQTALHDLQQLLERCSADAYFAYKEGHIAKAGTQP